MGFIKRCFVFYLYTQMSNKYCRKGSKVEQVPLWVRKGKSSYGLIYFVRKRREKIMTKDQVLLLLKEQNDYISGEAMSRKIGVSRAAIHTAVKKLRAEGYEIVSATNRGYRLEKSVDCLTAGEIRSYLKQERKAKIIYYEETDSTNTRLKELAQAGEKEGTVVVATAQNAGRGRLGRNFTSGKDKGIYLSILFRPQNGLNHIPEITAWVSVCVSKAVERVTGQKPGIKWVNDIVMGGKKICGILTEMAMEGESGYIQYLIVGIGINVHYKTSDFPKELQEKASSLDAVLGKTVNRAELAAAVIEELDSMYENWPTKKAEYLEYYRQACVNTNKQVRLLKNKEEKFGTALEITDNFGLLVEYEDGTREEVSSGEVSVRGIYGYMD